MKKIFLFSAVMLLAVVNPFAQDQQRDQIREQEHYMLKDGKMYQIRNQEQVQLQEKVMLKNGSSINPDGTLELKNKKQLKLKNGECLDPQGNRYGTQQAFHEQIQKRQQAMAQEHLMMQNGQMYRIKNQEKVQLKEKISLKNGSTVNPDGSLQLRDKKQLKLRDGECIDMDGNRYENQDRFRDKMMQRNQDRLDKGKEKISPDKKGKKNQ